MDTTMLCPQFLQQSLRLLEVSGVKAFGKPTIDRYQQLAGLVPLAVLLS